MSFRARSLVLPILGFFAGCASLPREGAAPGPKMAEVEASGWAPAGRGAAPGACRRAVADAQSRAIGKAAGVLVLARTRVEDGVALGQEITADARGVIRRYGVLDENFVGGACRVRIRALVEIPGPGQEPGRDASWPVPPHTRVVVEMRAQEPQAEAWIREADAAAAAQLAAHGFEVVADSSPDAGFFAWTVQGRVAAYHIKDAQLGAFVSYRGVVSAEILSPAGVSPIWKKSLEAPALGLDAAQTAAQAAQNAAAQAGKAAAQALVAHLANSLLNSSFITYNLGRNAFQNPGHRR